MQIQFVNHSSFVVHSGDIHLLCDFWKDGSAFDNGWDLLCETKFDYADFEKITHIWFSHEHPDHFSPPNLKSIPEEFRKNITILFQETADQRLVSFCKKLNFAAIVELQPYSPLKISPECEIICAPYGASYADIDSWLCVRTPAKTLLNINDCEFELDKRLERIKAACGPIDLLATQFSFASKQGDRNKPWIDKAKHFYIRKLESKVSAFSPTYVLPFASFVYWSHVENRYLNEGAIQVHEAATTISKSGSIPIVMYPQDTWTLGDSWDNAPALKRYSERYTWLANRPDAEFNSSDSVADAELITASQSFLEKMRKDVDLSRLKKVIAMQHADIRHDKPGNGLKRRAATWWAGLTSNYERGRIYVEDHGAAYEFSLEDGLQKIDLPAEQCHISIGSQALHYCFAFAFGGETLQINGRFQNRSVDGWKYLSCFFFLARRLEQKFKIPEYVLISATLRSLNILPK